MKIKALKNWQKEQLVSNGFLDWQMRSFEVWARRECAQGNRRRMARALRSLTAIKNK
jgi:hypothetical protein